MAGTGWGQALSAIAQGTLAGQNTVTQRRTQDKWQLAAFMLDEEERRRRADMQARQLAMQEEAQRAALTGDAMRMSLAREEFDLRKADRAKRETSEATTVQALMQAYPQAGITAADTLASAQVKAEAAEQARARSRAEMPVGDLLAMVKAPPRVPFASDGTLPMGSIPDFVTNLQMGGRPDYSQVPADLLPRAQAAFALQNPEPAPTYPVDVPGMGQVLFLTPGAADRARGDMINAALTPEKAADAQYAPVEVTLRNGAVVTMTAKDAAAYYRSLDTKAEAPGESASTTALRKSQTDLNTARTRYLGIQADWYGREAQAHIDSLKSTSEKNRATARGVAQRIGKGQADTRQWAALSSTNLRAYLGALADEGQRVMGKWKTDKFGAVKYTGTDEATDRAYLQRLEQAYQQGMDTLYQQGVQGAAGQAGVSVPPMPALNITVNGAGGAPGVPRGTFTPPAPAKKSTAWANKYTSMMKPKGAAITLKTSEGYAIQDLIKGRSAHAAKARTILAEVVNNALRRGETLTDTQVADRLYDELLRRW